MSRCESRLSSTEPKSYCGERELSLVLSEHRYETGVVANSSSENPRSIMAGTSAAGTAGEKR